MKTVEIISKGERYELLLDDNIDLPSKPFIRGKYAQIIIQNSASGKPKAISVHRYIMNLGKGTRGTGVFVDHINGNVLDNRLENLREATNKMNQGNRISKGYHWKKSKGKYVASISAGDGTTKYLGSFEEEEDAKCAYRKAHIEKFGEFSPYYNDQLYFDFDTNEIKSL